MLAQLPEVAGLRDRMVCLIDLEEVVFVLLLVAYFLDDQVDLGNLKTCDGDIEVALNGQQVLKFDCENRRIPTSLLGKPVVSETVGAKLIGSQTFHPNRRHMIHAQ